MRDQIAYEAGAVTELGRSHYRWAVYLAPFDLAALRAYREHEVWGNAFRRPSRYAPLTDFTIQTPFARRDGDGQPFARHR